MEESSSGFRDRLYDSELESVYRRHGRRIYSLCLRLLADVRVAEEATSDVFAQFGRDWARWKDEPQTQLRLREMAIDVALARLGKEHGKAETLASLCVCASTSRSGLVLARLEPAVLDVIIAQLPSTERAAYVLRYVEGMSDAAVAIRLRVTKAAIRRLLHKARLQLRELWLVQQAGRII
ncbi:MAG: sigma factor-like helix-turn-helix DNA-binding protein [Acidobacteriota bacterium]